MFRPQLRIVLAVVACMALQPASASLKKAFQALNEHNYFLARQLFLKQTKKEPEAAWYGLSVISGRNNNPFYQLDSAHVYIMRSDAAFTLANDKRRQSLAKLGVDHEAIEAQKRHVFDLAWNIAEEEHTIEAYQRYISVYATSHRLLEAIRIRDQLAFEKARDLNTSAAYEEFLRKYPGAREVYEARSRMQEAIYRENTVEGDIRSYLEFIQRFPESSYVRNAEEEVFKLSTPDRTTQQYRRFINDHPTNHKVADAWRSIYANETRDMSVNAINRFLMDNPDYPFVEELADDYRMASMTLLPYRKDGLWGFIDDEGIERIQAEFEWVEDFKGGQAMVGMNGKVGTINRSGKEVVPIKYDEMLDPVEGISTVELNEKTGGVDRGGVLVVPLEFEDVGEFSQGLAYAAKNGKYGYIDVRGKEVVPFRFTSASTFKNGLAVVELDDGYGVIDTKGNMVVAAENDWIEGFDNEVSRIRRDGVMGLISPFGDELLEVKYKHIGPFMNGTALIVDGRKCGYVDMAGRLVVPIAYEAPEGVANWGDMVNGLAEVQQGGKRCLINAQDQKVMPCQFADIGPATGHLIPFRKRTKWGYADRNGTVLFDNRYDQAFEMVNGLARVKNGDLMGAIDSTGGEVIPLRYLAIGEVRHGLVTVTDERGTGLLDLNGREVIPAAFDAVLVIHPKIARVERSKAFGYIRTTDGKLIWREPGLQVLSAPASPE